jgi:signal transduction histidine kinase
MVSISLTYPPSFVARAPRSALPIAAGVASMAVCGLAVALVAATTPSDERFARALLEGLIVGVPLAVGLYATRTARTLRFGMTLMAAGVAWSLTALAQSSDSLLYSAGRLSAWLIFPALFYLMLTFPNGRLAPGVDRRLFGGLILLISLLYIGSSLFVEAFPQGTPWASCESDCPPNAFLVLNSEPAVMGRVVEPVRELLSVLLLVGVARSLFMRWRVAAPLRRRTIGPVIVMSIVSTLILGAFLAVRRVAPDTAAIDPLGLVWSATIPGVAAAFMVGFLRRRVMVGHVLARLSLGLTQRLDQRRLRATLVAALNDTTVDVLVPDGVPGRWRDTKGRITSRSALIAKGCSVTSIDDDEGNAVAALVHDPALGDDDELLEAIQALLLATLEHERLTDRLASSLNELDASRQRIARAADVERLRIERDLHDGAQQRLIGLRIKLSLAEEVTHTDAVAGAEAMHRLGTEVDRTLEELRSLARGVYPSLLSDRGIADALRGGLAESPLPVHFSALGLTRHPPEVETAVYFVCLEAVQNAIKHARRATGLWVSVQENHLLRFEVRDDGSGFVPPSGASPGGLRNMRDRVEAVGGRLTIDAAPGQGTRIRGVVPLRNRPARPLPDPPPARVG